jgi:hypothetical protein
MISEIRTRLLERLTGKKLLTPELDAERDGANVAKLLSKGYPKGYFENATGNDGDSSSFSLDLYSKDEIIGFTGKNDAVVMMRKAFPHCLYGLMLIKRENKDEVAITDFNDADRYSFYKIAEEFAYFCESQNISPVISWTYDPETRDRKSGQSQLWYHMHLNSYAPEERQSVQKTRGELKNYKGKEAKRAMIDEFSVVSSVVLKDYLDKEGHVSVGDLVGPFEFGSLPNLGIVIPKGWEHLLSSEFDSDMKKIHDAVCYVYDLIKEKIFHHESDKWQRPIKSGIKITQKDFPWMSDKTLSVLNNFLDNLDPDLFKSHGEFFRKNPKSKLTSHLYPLAGASYCTSITKVDGGKLLLSIRPQMFSDTGAAGLHYAFNTTVKVERGSEVYSEEELRSKERFEKGFSEFLNLANFERPKN